MIVLLTFAVGRAHGPPAAVTGVAAVNGSGPTHVELTEGLAVRDGESWRYVCPAAWGSTPLSPTAAGLHDGAVFLPGTGGLFVADETGLVEPTGGGPPITVLLGLARDDEAILALATGETALRTVWDVAAGGVEVWSGDEPFTGIAPWDGDVHLVGPVEGVLVHVVLDAVGAEVSRVELGAAESTNPVLRATPSAVWLVERSTGAEQLATFADRTPIGPTVKKVLGPIEVDGRTWVALDGMLHEVLGDAVVASVDPRVVECLDGLQGEGWACAEGLLHSLSGDGVFGDPIVGPTDVGPPDLERVDETDVAMCFSEWRVWAGDAGVPPGEPPPLELADRGCGCDSDGGSALGAFLVPWLFRRRRCTDPSPSS